MSIKSFIHIFPLKHVIHMPADPQDSFFFYSKLYCFQTEPEPEWNVSNHEVALSFGINKNARCTQAYFPTGGFSDKGVLETGAPLYWHQSTVVSLEQPGLMKMPIISIAGIQYSEKETVSREKPTPIVVYNKRKQA